MQRDSIPSEVDYETRQGVYSICLQLARCRMPLSPTHTHRHTHIEEWIFWDFILICLCLQVSSGWPEHARSTG